MITERKPLSMTEAVKYVGDEKDSETEVKKFVKKFVKIKPEKAKGIRKKLEELDLLKMKSEHVAKIIDLVPENAENLNKIFTDISLDEDETKKILETIGEFK
jgi:DNA-directed RNA polymerase subunit F